MVAEWVAVNRDYLYMHEYYMQHAVQHDSMIDFNVNWESRGFCICLKRKMQFQILDIDSYIHNPDLFFYYNTLENM